MYEFVFSFLSEINCRYIPIKAINYAERNGTNTDDITVNLHMQSLARQRRLQRPQRLDNLWPLLDYNSI
jgi:hypothetical protein